MDDKSVVDSTAESAQSILWTPGGAIGRSTNRGMAHFNQELTEWWLSPLSFAGPDRRWHEWLVVTTQKPLRGHPGWRRCWCIKYFYNVTMTLLQGDTLLLLLFIQNELQIYCTAVIKLKIPLLSIPDQSPSKLNIESATINFKIRYIWRYFLAIWQSAI